MRGIKHVVGGVEHGHTTSSGRRTCEQGHRSLILPVSNKDNNVRRRKRTKNKGDHMSLLWVKRHQRVMGMVQEQAIEMVLPRHLQWVRPYGSAMWNASPYGSALASGHQTTLHQRVWHDCWAQSNLGWHRPSSDLDVGDTALGDRCSDGY